jgi:hypothetical protein
MDERVQEFRRTIIGQERRALTEADVAKSGALQLPIDRGKEIELAR